VKPTTINDLYSYTFLGNMKTSANSLVFVKANCGEEENTYEQVLYDYRASFEQPRQLTSFKKESNFAYKDPNTIGFISNRSMKKIVALCMRSRSMAGKRWKSWKSIIQKHSSLAIWSTIRSFFCKKMKKKKQDPSTKFWTRHRFIAMEKALRIKKDTILFYTGMDNGRRSQKS